MGAVVSSVETTEAGEVFRHFIGLSESTGMHFAVSVGPGRPEDLPPNEPLEFGVDPGTGADRLVYPVSEAIADEWTRGEE